jgi:hypothetical protein
VNRKILPYATAALAAGAGALIVAASPAAAAPPAPVCRTAVTTLVDRPDSGFHGDWAKDAIVRTVKICETGPADTNAVTVEKAVARSMYTATVSDAGTFTTVAGLSPGAGVALPAGVKGLLAGGFGATFTAKAGFKQYKGVFDGKTYSGTAPSSTGDWVMNLWGGNDFTSVTNLVAWKWTYWTCNKNVAKATEKWVNADPDVNLGDITGKACPAPVESASASASTGGGGGGAPAASSSGTAAGGLPVTGSSVGLAVGVAVALLAVGSVLFVAARRRRREFTA